MSTLGLLAVLVAALVVGVSPTPAATQLDLARCLQLTTTTTLRSKAILNNLGLTPDQVRELRGRLAQYHSVRGFPGLEGVGLTPEQKAEIQRRIAVQVAAMNRYPLGWPCKPFKNPVRVVTFVKSELIANGFRPRMTFRKTSPRQYQFQAIQDGLSYIGVVVKSLPRQVTVRLIGLDTSSGGTYKFTLSFEA